MQTSPQSTIDLPGIEKLRSGKVREVFDLGKTLLFVATDRLSAFDVILPDPIPHKGAVLNQLSAFWFKRFDNSEMPREQRVDIGAGGSRATKTGKPERVNEPGGELINHFVTANFDEFPKNLQSFHAQLAGRSMIVRKARPLPVECVARGYLAGSGWKEYRESGRVCGVKLPAGLQLASELPEPIFTPTTKSDTGHDENIDWKTCCTMLGEEVARRVRDLSLQLYRAGKEHAANCGIIVADTKFEFGFDDGDQLILIDECLTPDSSRFWPADQYVVGQSPPSFDKQFVRDYLETLDWNKTPPAPQLPKDVIEKTSAKYLEAFRRLTSSEIAPH
jgi:phosphoribosylaminoimidazole-succinocarboxamide synthase